MKNLPVENTSEVVSLARAYGCKEAITRVAHEDVDKSWFLFFMVKDGKRIEGASNESIEAAAAKFLHQMNKRINHDSI